MHAKFIYVTFVIAQNYFVIFATLGIMNKLILHSLIAKSNQKARAVPKKLKNKNKSYYDLNSDKQPALKNIVLACRFYASILITYNLAKNRCLTDLFIFFFTLFKAMHITQKRDAKHLFFDF